MTTKGGAAQGSAYSQHVDALVGIVDNERAELSVRVGASTKLIVAAVQCKSTLQTLWQTGIRVPLIPE
jgi:hypothetical protein